MCAAQPYNAQYNNTFNYEKYDCKFYNYVCNCDRDDTEQANLFKEFASLLHLLGIACKQMGNLSNEKINSTYDTLSKMPNILKFSY
jgi:hypothetical protein